MVWPSDTEDIQNNKQVKNSFIIQSKILYRIGKESFYLSEIAGLKP
jgi:hypothetical protein